MRTEAFVPGLGRELGGLEPERGTVRGIHESSGDGGSRDGRAVRSRVRGAVNARRVPSRNIGRLKEKPDPSREEKFKYWSPRV